MSDSIFENIDYDLVTIGNHGVRTWAEALNIHYNLSRVFGDRFLTSNVDVEEDKKLKSIGNRYRAFQTRNGLRIVAFGVTVNDPILRDLNHTEVHNASWIFEQEWFAEAMKKEADLYVIVGHIPTYASCLEFKSCGIAPFILKAAVIRLYNPHILPHSSLYKRLFDNA